ncbi:DMP19 family protein [Veillonella parvula]|uniref:DMP19 family protein n=1 Tax=Veillonella parvula TaxID=29466 RepID=UPI0007673B5E|nr:DMP19 family protein [Veillonella parvula]KXB83310.1 hypothetical protein HMPREF1865_01531 [Veillonella parvula]
MSIPVEQFLSFSESEQLQTVKELNDIGNVKTIIDVLTSVGIENLSIPLLGKLGRAYNNNGNEKEAIKVLESINEEYRDVVWYYRCAYAYGAVALDNNESYTSDIMKQMLRLVDQAVRLVQEKNLDDIKSYCFEVIDMCYMQMDFEQCEAEYPELCKAYSNYVAEKKKKREGVPRHRTITIEEIQATDDMWTINEPMYWTINIYGSHDDYLESAKGFTLEQRYLNAICWYFAEVNNGGHHQFLYNSTGIVWEDALTGLQRFKMDELADNFQTVLDYFGGTVPFDRAERWHLLQQSEDDPEFFEFLDEKDDAVYTYDGILEDVFVHENPQLFVFDGTYMIPE